MKWILCKVQQPSALFNRPKSLHYSLLLQWISNIYTRWNRKSNIFVKAKKLKMKTACNENFYNEMKQSQMRHVINSVHCINYIQMQLNVEGIG